jgi:hypothetical protein
MVTLYPCKLRDKQMKTKLHRYYFDTSNPDELEAYNELNKTLKATPGRGQWMNVYPTASLDYKNVPIGEVTLETKHLFSNQWNTECGHRVFDWYEGIYPNKSIKRGHYLDITPEMTAIRDTTFKCGYCGKEVNKGVYHLECLSSEYITPECFSLLHPKAVSDTTRYEKLTKEEMERYTTLWFKAKEHHARASIESNVAAYKKDREIQERKFSLKIRLLERGIPKDLFIVYDLDNVTFGWNEPVSELIADWLEAKLKNMDIPWTIKSVNGVKTYKH